MMVRLICLFGLTILGWPADKVVIRNPPLYLADSARAWLEHLPTGQIHDWVSLKEDFVSNFQGTCA